MRSFKPYYFEYQVPIIKIYCMPLFSKNQPFQKSIKSFSPIQSERYFDRWYKNWAWRRNWAKGGLFQRSLCGWNRWWIGLWEECCDACVEGRKEVWEFFSELLKASATCKFPRARGNLLFENAVKDWIVHAHVETHAHTLGAGPHDLSDDFDGLAVSHQREGHDNAFTHRDLMFWLDKNAPGIDVGNVVDEAEVVRGASDFQGTFPPCGFSSLCFRGVWFQAHVSSSSIVNANSWPWNEIFVKWMFGKKNYPVLDHLVKKCHDTI